MLKPAALHMTALVTAPLLPYDCPGVMSLAPCTSLSQTAACRLQGSAQALIGLLEACEAVLPQARRARLAREARRHAVARSRARQKSGGRRSLQRSACVLSMCATMVDV